MAPQTLTPRITALMDQALAGQIICAGSEDTDERYYLMDPATHSIITEAAQVLGLSIRSKGVLRPGGDVFVCQGADIEHLATHLHAFS